MTAYEMRISDWSSDVCSSDLLLLLFKLSCRRIERGICSLPAILPLDFRRNPHFQGVAQWTRDETTKLEGLKTTIFGIKSGGDFIGWLCDDKINSAARGVLSK